MITPRYFNYLRLLKITHSVILDYGVFLNYLADRITTTNTYMPIAVRDNVMAISLFLFDFISNIPLFAMLAIK